MQSVVADTFSYWKVNEGAVEYVVLLFIVAQWNLAVCPQSLVGGVAEHIRKLCSGNPDLLWQDKTYNEMEMIDLVRMLYGYVRSRDAATDTIVIALPKCITESGDFRSLVEELDRSAQLMALFD
eukprot:gb/GECG01001175.1/.p1 GENE.gb/GECG01001175.1/~~gb/GECG01001175.1/.p1  ORF type:complete len:124 (+),score=12.56 gb/GECG01001175.1/:1-372(+)